MGSVRRGSAVPSDDPHLRRWMLFVDGENLTARAQELAKCCPELQLAEGQYYVPDVFVWMPEVQGTEVLTNLGRTRLRVQEHAIRAYYYTSATGDSDRINTIEEALWALGFQAQVFKRTKERGAK